jgi:cytochrome P450
VEDPVDTGGVHPSGPQPAPRNNNLTSAIFTDGFLTGNPHTHLALLRSKEPVAYDPDHGVYVLSGYPDVVAVSRDPRRFSSARGILLSEIGVEYAAPPTMMHTDPPDHTRYRKLVQPVFSRQAVAEREPALRARARAAVERLTFDSPIDVVAELAVPYPIQVIADILGIPEHDWPRFFEWSEAAIPGATDLPEEKTTELMVQMMAYLLGVAVERRFNPRDDVVSHLATVESDGDRLDDHELAMFMVQLLIAGNETTRNALSGALVAFAEHPDQWERLQRDRRLLVPAVEEILRWTSPVVYFLRTTTQPVLLGGQAVPQGSPLMLLYLSANRDPMEFGPTADEFDIGRQPNNHLAFGFGPHFCLGAALARVELRLLFESLLDRVSAFELAGPVTRSMSLVIAGVRHAPMTLHSR